VQAREVQWIEEPRTSPETFVMQLQSHRTLATMMALLSPEQQAVVKAAFFAGRTASEIAAEWDLPLGTVKTRLRLALKTMRISRERLSLSHT
jgi:RNA polymerase sigma-70 factor, ECF subfamily